MTRLLTLVVLSLAMVFTPGLGEARSKRIHVNAEIVQQIFTAEEMAQPKLGDQLISSVKLRDKHNDEVGTGAGFCTVVSVPPLDTRVQCLLSATFDDEGQIIFGGVAPLPVPGGAATFAILGGTDAFRKARGEVTLTVISDKFQDAVFEIE
jgi:hypothetical protein